MKSLREFTNLNEQKLPKKTEKGALMFAKDNLLVKAHKDRLEAIVRIMDNMKEGKFITLAEIMATKKTTERIAKWLMNASNTSAKMADNKTKLALEGYVTEENEHFYSMVNEMSATVKDKRKAGEHWAKVKLAYDMFDTMADKKGVPLDKLNRCIKDLMDLSKFLTTANLDVHG